MLDFQELADFRHRLQEFCSSHVSSLELFRSEPSFKLHIGDTLGSSLRHLTTTSTCIQSLLDCPTSERPAYAEPMAQQYARLAIERTPEEWKSEESAGIYCRCRALPFVVRHLPKYDRRLRGHLTTILAQLEEPDRFAIGEADPDPKIDRRYWYPPNAFHTFWFLAILESLKIRDFDSKLRGLSLNAHKDEMLLWAKSLVGRQISLHVANSSGLDSDQLAWALAIVMRYSADFQFKMGDQDFIREGLKALFSKQTTIGTWPHGQPLFHYKYSGNAYCYIFETFTVLLKIVLESEKAGEFLRSALQPHFSNLVSLFEYAEQTQIILHPQSGKKSLGGRSVGWSSGHRIDDPNAEGWATASVFSYAQALRRLVGEWTRECGAMRLNRMPATHSPEKALQVIVERGDTWPFLKTSRVSEQLLTLFVNPVLSVEPETSLEPDTRPLQLDQARSAILFGPPGTSKTSLAHAVAEAIGWQYIELHASHFVAEGLPAVQRTADKIFRELMELDHAVVLFDEIDELVRERDVEPDAFGRFLTTSMLPKLAELWKQRKVIYFIATNHIEYFDKAVTRAQRFDALIFVTPPSFEKKTKKLGELLAKLQPGLDVRIQIAADEIDAALAGVDCDTHRDDKRLPSKLEVAKFILLRWDQIDELAFRINDLVGPAKGVLTVSRDSLEKGLAEIADPSLDLRKTYCDYLRAGKYSMKDYSKHTVWEVDNLPSNTSYSAPLSSARERVWLTCSGSPDNLSLGTIVFERTNPGHVKSKKLLRRARPRR